MEDGKTNKRDLKGSQSKNMKSKNKIVYLISLNWNKLDLLSTYDIIKIYN